MYFADKALLLVPDEMPVGAVGEFVDDDMVVGKTQWLVIRRLYTFPTIYEPVSESEAQCGQSLRGRSRGNCLLCGRGAVPSTPETL